MLPKETVNKYETPLNKKKLIPKNNSIQNNKTLQIFCKDLTKINIPNECGWTPLYRTVIAGDIASTNLLLNNGADPNVKCTMGETPLFQAVDMEKFDQVKILLKNGANPNIANDDGLTPLHNAVTKKDIAIVKILLKYGADPNKKTKFYQQTPLHLAIKNNADPMILLLLVQFNGSLMDEDKFNKKPIDYANSKEMKNIIEKLKFGKDNSNIIKEKEIQNFQTPKKMSKWNPSNVYSNTIYSQSYGKNLAIEGSNAILQNPGSVKINILSNNNNAKNYSIKTVKRDLFNSNDKSDNLRDIDNKIDDYKEESINEIHINSAKTKKDKSQNAININAIEDKENINLYSNLIISNQKEKTRKFSFAQEDNILAENSKNRTLILNLKKNKINKHSFENESRNKINFSFSTNTFNNKIKNSSSQEKEIEDKENNKNNTNINIKEENKNEIDDSNIKISTKEKKQNLNSSIKSVINRDKTSDKYLYEKIIKKSITKIEIFDEYNKFNESISKTIKSDLNEEDSKTKFANEFMFNKPILNNNLTFIKKTKIFKMKPSYMIYLNKSSGRIDNKIPKRNSLLSKVKYNFNKNLSFHKKGITADQININKNFKKNIKTRNEKAIPLSRVSLTTLGTSGNELNSNKSSLWEILNEVISNEKSLYQSFSSNNINSEFDNDYDYEYEQNIKYPIYNWLKEIKLHCYYNLFREKNILSMNNIISNLKTGKYNITKIDIGRIGIIIPGHIYRIITKLEIDSNKIKEKITDNIIKNKNRASKKDINITKNSVNFCCGCCALNEEIHKWNNVKKLFNLEQWLSEINMIKYKENFIENGFDFFEYFILQMFSTIPIDDYILKEELKIEEEKDRDIILLKLNIDIKYLIQRNNNVINDIKNTIFYDDDNLLNNEFDNQKNQEDSDCIII